MTLFPPPPGYERIKIVSSFQELVETPLGEGINALCWRRALSGDFVEIARHLDVGEGMVSLGEECLRELSGSVAGRQAIEILIEDQRLLRAHGLAPELNCIGGYPRDDGAGPVPVDVYSFHMDSAPVETDTYLCSYNATSSEGLRNDEAWRCVDIPETRAALLELFGGEDGYEFREYLRECCYDLHYEAAEGARPFSFGVGHLWRIAVEYPGNPVPGCIHRAPVDRGPRLLLIS